MLIIIEGPDGAGKTTLAKQLEEHLAFGVLLHRGPPERHPLYEYETSLYFYERYRPGKDAHVVCDRWHLGEVVYPQALSRKSLLNPASLWHIEMFLESRGAFLVHLTDETALLQDRIARRGDNLITPDQVGELRVAYTAAVQRSRLPKVQLYTSHDLTQAKVWEVTQLIINAARNVERLHLELARFPTYVGPRWPDLLLLGDVRGRPGSTINRIHQRVDSPAFMPLPGTSGKYLLTTLLEAGGVDPSRARIGIANACDVDDPRALWATLGHPQTVALGRNAQRVATWAEPVDHPQYVRRFHHHERAAYANWILQGHIPPWRTGS